MKHRTAEHGETMPQIQLRGETPAHMSNNNPKTCTAPRARRWNAQGGNQNERNSRPNGRK